MLLTFVLVACLGGLQAAAESNRNVTIECSFLQISDCLNRIASLGGNVTSMYAEEKLDLNKTCSANVSPNSAFLTCIAFVPQNCDLGTQQLTIAKIEDLVKKLCKNGSDEQNNFLNSSACYNKNINRRRHCVQLHATSKTDAKSRCCHSKKIQECLKNDLRSVCPINSTTFQNSLLETYSGYTNLLCTDFNKRCGAAANVLSLTCLLLALKATFLARWQFI